MQKLPFFIHFLFVQNAENLKLNLQKHIPLFLKGIANQTFMHNIQKEMLILTFW